MVKPILEPIIPRTQSPQWIGRGAYPAPTIYAINNQSPSHNSQIIDTSDAILNLVFSL